MNYELREMSEELRKSRFKVQGDKREIKGDNGYHTLMNKSKEVFDELWRINDLQHYRLNFFKFLPY